MRKNHVPMPRKRSPLTKAYQDSVRQSIKTSLLINTLQNNALGRLKRPMSDGQIKSAIALLKKVLPDLQSMEISTGEGQMRYVVVGVPIGGSIEQWQQEYGYLPSPTATDGETIEGEITQVEVEPVRQTVKPRPTARDKRRQTQS